MLTPTEAAELILRAAGSSYRHYTMPTSQQAILAAVRRVQQDAFEAGQRHEAMKP